MKEKKKIAIIGVPLDLGVKELGLKLGPDALRKAKLIEICRYLGMDVEDKGNVKIQIPSARDDNSHIESIARCCNDLAIMVGESIERGYIPICLGGDHSLAIGSIAGMVSKLGQAGCVWIDAHPDANTPETSPSGNIHGMPVAVLLGHGPETLADVGSKGSTLKYENLVLLGTRDIDEGEIKFIKQHNVKMFTIFDVLEKGLSSVVDETIKHLCKKTKNLHISLDLDVLRSEIAPGVGLPSRCGFDMREAIYLCRRFAAECNITSIDIVGLNPVQDRGMITAHGAIEILMELLGYSFSYNYYTYLKEQV